MSLHDPHGLPRSRASLSPVFLAGVLGGLAALSGCGDSPLCVFGGDCSDEDVNDVPGGIGREPAAVRGQRSADEMAMLEAEISRLRADVAAGNAKPTAAPVESVDPGGLTVGALEAKIRGMSMAQLETIEAAEKAGKSRTTALTAIETEQGFALERGDN